MPIADNDVQLGRGAEDRPAASSSTCRRSSQGLADDRQAHVPAEA